MSQRCTRHHKFEARQDFPLFEFLFSRAARCWHLSVLWLCFLVAGVIKELVVWFWKDPVVVIKSLSMRSLVDQLVSGRYNNQRCSEAANKISSWTAKRAPRSNPKAAIAGKGVTNPLSLIHDEQFRLQAWKYVRANSCKRGEPNLMADMFQKWAQEQFECEISNETARLWLRSLGFAQKYHKKGVYFDGHERQDVVEYREQFV